MNNCNRVSNPICTGGILAAVFLATAAVAVAQETALPAQQPVRQPQPQAATQKFDLQKGADKFYQLGLPDVAKAVYVRLQMYDPRQNMDYSGMNILNEMRLSGNAWLLKENKAGKSLFLTSDARLVEVYDQKVLAKIHEDEMKRQTNKAPAAIFSMHGGYGGYGDSRIGATWKPADMAKDVAAIAAHLKKAQAREAQMSRYSGRYNRYGDLFIALMHFNRRGLTNETAGIAQSLFAMAPARTVIMQGLNSLANAKYAEAYGKFLDGGSWKTFETDINALSARFSASGWERAAAVKRLVAAVSARSATASPPPVAGEGLSETDQKIASELCGLSNAPALQTFGHGGIWLFRKQGGKTAADKGDALTRIAARGMESIPLLVAMLDDHCLTRLDITPIRNMTGMHASFDDSRTTDPEAMAEAQYNSMPRPAERSDIASLFLRPLLIFGEQEQHMAYSMDRDDIKTRAAEWMKQHGGKSRHDLALLYLEQGDQSQRQYAMTELIAGTNDADMATIEKHLLSMKDPVNNSYLAQSYVTARREKAAAFVDKYIALINSSKNPEEEDPESAAMRISMGEGDYRKTMISNIVTQMKQLVSMRSAKDVIADILSGKMDMMNSNQEIYSALAREKKETAAEMLLKAAIACTNSGTASMLVSMVPQVPYMSMQAGMGMMMPGDEMDDPAEGAGPQQGMQAVFDLKLHADLWRKLLADSRPASLGTVGDIVAMVINQLNLRADDPELMNYHMNYGKIYQLGRRLNAIYRARAEAKLAGKPGSEMPPYPSADKVGKQQVDAMMAKIAAAADEKAVAQAVAALNLDELLALEANLKKDDKLNAKLAGPAHTIQLVECADNSLEKELAGLKGGKLDRNAVKKLIEIAKRLSLEGKYIACAAVRQGCIGGVDIRITVMAPDSKEFQMYGMAYSGMPGASGREAAVSGMIQAPGVAGRATWPSAAPAQAPAAAQPAAQPGGNTEADRLIAEAVKDLDASISALALSSDESFWKGLDDLLSGKGSIAQAASVMITGMPKLKPEEAKQSGYPEMFMGW